MPGFGTGLLETSKETTRIVVLLALVIVALAGISEISERQEAYVALGRRVDELRAELLAAKEQASPDPKKEEALQQEISVLARAREDVASLVSYGAEFRAQTLSGIRISIRSHDPAHAPAGPADNDSIDDGLASWFGAEGTLGILGWFLQLTGFRFYYSRSEMLLAVVILGCATIGTLVSGFRNNEPLRSRHITLGIASGFIAFLSIKGGKSVFLVVPADVQVSVNAYSGAFAALLAGLFTERFHQLLSSLVETLARRVESIVGQD